MLAVSSKGCATESSLSWPASLVRVHTREARLIETYIVDGNVVDRVGRTTISETAQIAELSRSIVATRVGVTYILVVLYDENKSRAWTSELSGLTGVDDCPMGNILVSESCPKSCLPMITCRMFAFSDSVAAFR